MRIRCMFNIFKSLFIGLGLFDIIGENKTISRGFDERFYYYYQTPSLTFQKDKIN